MVVLPAPPTVNGKPPLVMPPDTVSVPASAFTRAALPNVIVPDHVLVLASWRSAPPPAMPVPFSVTGSATTSPLPSSCSAAPPATVVARSEEHTSELQSRLHLVCRLLLEKKKTKTE